MQRGLKLAERGWGKTYPNPMVGAVVVKDGAVIGEGWHRGPGTPHAEAAALTNCVATPRGATLYITLEPCNHYGRTPPCTEGIIAAGIAKVHYAVADPNPQVTGGGAQWLRQAGVIVEEGPLQKEGVWLNRAYLHHCRTGRPWVMAKAALSLDGKIALADGTSKWITGPKTRRWIHRLRAQAGAILIGSGTARRDNPSLTNRWSPKGRQPLKVVFDSQLSISEESRLVQEAPERLIVFCTDRAPAEKEDQLSAAGARVVRQAGRSRVDPVTALTALGELGVQSVLVEGGHEIYAAFAAAGLIQEYYLCYAPFFIGGDQALGMLGGDGLKILAAATRLKMGMVRRLDGDLLVQVYERGWEPECLPDWFKKWEK